MERQICSSALRSRRRRRPGLIAPLVEPLEDRRLLTTYHVYVSAPQTATAGSQFTINLFATGGTPSTYDVGWGDGTADSTPTPTSPMTSVTHTYASTEAGNQLSITVTSQSTGGANASATFALDAGAADNVGAYPGTGGGENVYTPSGSTASSGYAVAEDSSGNFYVAESYTPSGSTSEFAVTRFNSNDQVDTTFGQSAHPGTYVVSSFAGGGDVPAALYLSGQTLAIAGRSSTGFAVADLNIANGGSTNWTSASSLLSGQANAVYIDSSGNVVAFGNSGNNAAALKLDSPNGATDSSFGNLGVKTYSLSSTTTGQAIAIDPSTSFSSDLIFGGTATTLAGSSCSASFYVMAVNEGTGNKDSNFGTSGTTFVNIACQAGFTNASLDAEYSLVEDPEKLDLIGVGKTDANGTNQFALAAFANSNGTLDTAFGTNGVSIATSSDADAATAFAATVDTVSTSPTYGYIIASGATNTSADFVTARFDTSGSLDSSFGASGSFTQDFGSSTANTSDTARGVILETDESVVAVGGTTSSTGGIAVARMLEDNNITVKSSGGRPLFAPASAPDVFAAGPAITAAASDLDNGFADLLVYVQTRNRHRPGHLRS